MLTTTQDAFEAEKQDTVGSLMSQPQSTVQRSIQIIQKISENQSQNPEVKRWDLLLLTYWIPFCMVQFAFGSSFDGKYNTKILLGAFWHFASEMTLAWHLLFSNRTAYYLTVLTYIINVCLMILAFFTPIEYIGGIFFIEFLYSDGLSIISSIFLFMNPNAPQKLRTFTFGMSLHMIGVSLGVARIPYAFFVDYYTPLHGWQWFTLALSGIPQFYYTKDALMSKINDVITDNGQNNIDWQNSGYHTITKIVSLTFPLFMTTGATVMLYFSTTEDDFTWANGQVLIATLALWPLPVVLLLLTLKLWADGRNVYEKKQ